VRAQLLSKWMRVDAKEVDLSADMAVTFEIKTGQGRLIDLFPIDTHSGRQRGGDRRNE
jgi:hypothetical protein